MKGNKIIFFAILTVAVISGCQNGGNKTEADEKYLDLKGVYLGQEKPELEPALFAPGVISTGGYERDAAFSRRGKEMFYTVKVDDRYVLMYTFEEDEKWSKPEVAPFSGEYNDLEPCFAPFGKGLYFVSNRPVDGVEKDKWDFDIWYTIKTMEGWSEPQNLGAPVNTNQLEAFPTITRENTLYFMRNDTNNTRSDIFRAKFDSGAFKEPEKLPEIINADANPFNAAISPGESILVFCCLRDDGFGGSDYWISFRKSNDTWSVPVNLGERFNTPFHEKSPHFTPSGNYFFFSSEGNPPAIGDSLKILPQDTINSDIYWVKTEVLEDFE